MSIKTKIRSLIDAANAKTGKGDTDLTTAVQSLISEPSGITPSGNKAITPSETAQSGIDVANFKTVSVDAISSTYVGSGITKKAAATVAPSTSEQTVCASGVYTTGEQKVSAITPSIVGNLDASSFAASIVAAVEGKGVTVPAGTLLDGMAALIESIEAGGGGSGNFATGTFTTTDDITSNVVINHNLGVKPRFVIVFSTSPDAFTKSKPTILSFYYIYQYSSASYGHKYQSPDSSTASYNTGPINSSGTETVAGWYRVNVDETTFTLKQANISSKYGIGASKSFFWIAYGG